MKFMSFNPLLELLLQGGGLKVTSSVCGEKSRCKCCSNSLPETSLIQVFEYVQSGIDQVELAY